MTGRNENWTIREGSGPLVAVAVHSGSVIREEIKALIGIDDAYLRREEDRYTREWTNIVETSVVVNTSRFECDLNRPREKAVYLTPEEAWGMDIWRKTPPPDVVERSLQLHDEFYADLEKILWRKAKRHGRFVVFDIHSYCHRRGGPDAEPDPRSENPDINLGSGSMDRRMWAPIVESFMSDMKKFDYPGGKLDVRENVKFRGGYLSSWVHETFPEQGCALAIEVKKFYMDEWTGMPYMEHVGAVREALSFTVPNILMLLNEWD